MTAWICRVIPFIHSDYGSVWKKCGIFVSLLYEQWLLEKRVMQWIEKVYCSRCFRPGWGYHCKGCISFGLRSCCLCFCLFHAWKERLRGKTCSELQNTKGNQWATLFNTATHGEGGKGNKLWISFVVPNQVLSPVPLQWCSRGKRQNRPPACHRRDFIYIQYGKNKDCLHLITWRNWNGCHSVLHQSGVISKPVNMFDPFCVLKPGSQVIHQPWCLNWKLLRERQRWAESAPSLNFVVDSCWKFTKY